MDIAPISIDTTQTKTILECNMPTFGTQNFSFICLVNDWFLKYEDYPVVRASVGTDLYMGISSIPYQIKILPKTGYAKELSKDNITNFYIGMIAK